MKSQQYSGFTAISLKEKNFFPTCTELLIKGFEQAYEYCEKPKKEFNDFIILAIKQIKKIEEHVNSYNNETISQLVESIAHVPDQLKETEINTLITQFKDRWRAQNQFFTIFDVSVVKEVYVDPRMSEILGLEAGDFKTASVEVLDDRLSIYEREELYQSMRCALIAYFLFTIPLFNLNSDNDYYTAKFKIRTHRSKYKHLRERKNVYAEKKCFFSFKYNEKGKMTSQYHFDLYTILNEPEHEYVYANIVSNPIQSEFMNMLAYLINMYLLDISPKYLLLLDEKQHTDRYKIIADKIEKNILKHTKQLPTITEHQVADYFSKSIRKRIAQVFNKWDQRKNGSLIEINSDMEAVERAKQLGLLPIPPKIKEMMYQSIH